jgi:hypothetical protein
MDVKAPRGLLRYFAELPDPRMNRTKRHLLGDILTIAICAVNACLFVSLICQHLRDCGIDPKGIRFQTDNGTEFIGCTRQDGKRDGFGATVQGFKAIHKRIPVKAWSYNSDVETDHSTIENEFFDLENFQNLRDFHQRVGSYQAWYNILRPNMNKDHLSPLANHALPSAQDQPPFTTTSTPHPRLACS